MKVLFLGGPWHNERHEVLPGRPASAVSSLPSSFNVPLVDDDPEGAGPMGEASASAGQTVTLRPLTRRHVTYTRRFARSNGERLPVYVSPDYRGPARA